jgi:hypothetical protein
LKNENDSNQKEFSLKEFKNQANDDVKLDLSWTNEDMFQNKQEFSNVQVKLETKHLWDKFASIGTEMIITKCGRFIDLNIKLLGCFLFFDFYCLIRRMFPTFKVNVTGLEPQTKYILLMDIIPYDDSRYKYNNSEWNITGKAEPHTSNRLKNIIQR